MSLKLTNALKFLLQMNESETDLILTDHGQKVGLTLKFKPGSVDQNLTRNRVFWIEYYADRPLRKKIWSWLEGGELWIHSSEL